MTAPAILPVSWCGGSTDRMRPSFFPAARGNGSPGAAGGRGTRSPGELRPPVSIQSYEYGASRTCDTHGHTSLADAWTLTPRQATSVGRATHVSHGNDRATSSSVTPQRSPIPQPRLHDDAAEP